MSRAIRVVDRCTLTGMRDEVVRSSIWLEAELPSFPPLTEDIAVDVAIVGGGLTGLLSAWLIAREGRRVALFERGRLAAADTARSPAHLTCVTDLPLHEAVDRFGETSARLLWGAGTAGIDLIARAVTELRADCRFQWTPGYLHQAPDRPRDVARLRHDATLAARFGFDAQFLASVPGVGKPGVRFGRQAMFHPRRFAAALIDDLAAMGVSLYEDSALEALTPGAAGGAPQLQVGGHTVRCAHAILATHSPLFDGTLATPAAARVRDDLRVNTTFVIAAAMPSGSVPAALYWDTNEPYEHLRVENLAASQCALLGGLDVPARQSIDEGMKFGVLESRVRARLPGARVTHAWSAEVVESDDGMPFIGPVEDRILIATGMCGNGFTFGATAAEMLRDACLGRLHPCAELFSPTRPRWRSPLWRSLSRKLESLVHRMPGGPAPSSQDRPASH